MLLLVSLSCDFDRLWYFSIRHRSLALSPMRAHAETVFVWCVCVCFFLWMTLWGCFLLSINTREKIAQSFFACVRPTNCDLHTSHATSQIHGKRIKYSRISFMVLSLLLFVAWPKQPKVPNNKKMNRTRKKTAVTNTALFRKNSAQKTT